MDCRRKKCTDICPIGYNYKYEENGEKLCLSYCTSDLYTSGKDKCVKDCTVDSLYFMITKENRKICTDKCEGGVNYLDIENNICVEDCSSLSPPKYTYKNMCYSSCPLDTFEDSDSLLCLDKCSDNDKFQAGTGNICVTSCQDPFPKIYDNKCVSECPSEVKYTIGTDNHCVNSCDSSHPFYSDKKCVSNCYDELVNKFRLDKDCISKCPDTSPFIFEETSLKIRECVSECQSPYIFIEDKKCSLSCSGTKAGIPPTYVCSEICSDDLQYKLDGVCVDKCSDEKPYILNGKCVDKCDGADYLLNTQTNECVSSCRGDLAL